MMLHHPEVVKRAQEEIDRVVGTDRLPTYEDRVNLPYLECIVKEIFRFNPAVPIGEWMFMAGICDEFADG